MKWNLLRLKISLTLILLCCTGTVAAKSCLDVCGFQPYLGLEYQYAHIKPALNYRDILSADWQSGNLFVGTKFYKNLFGLEVGYFRTIETAQQQDVVFGFGNQQASGVTALLTRTSFKGFSFDFDIYYALDPKFNIYALFGFATMHPTMTFAATNGTDLAAAFPLIKAKNRTVPRLGFGLELLAKHWGIRSRVIWVYTQDFKYDVTAAQAIFPGITNNPYVQAVQVTAGAFFRF